MEYLELHSSRCNIPRVNGSSLTWGTFRSRYWSKPRWTSESAAIQVLRNRSEVVLHFSCCPMWGYFPSKQSYIRDNALWSALKFSPRIREVAMRLTSSAGLGEAYVAIHIRRGDYKKAKKYAIYNDVLSLDFFLDALEAEGVTKKAMVYVATDGPTSVLTDIAVRARDRGHEWTFWGIGDLDSAALEADLMSLPPAFWGDFFGVIEQQICVSARSFVASWPSTFSSVVLNMRQAVAGSKEPLFRKLRSSCVDVVPLAATAWGRVFLHRLMPLYKRYGLKNYTIGDMYC